jgi:hypothetical protein
MAGVSQTTEAKDLDNGKGRVEVQLGGDGELGGDGDLGGGDATAGDEAMSDELARDGGEAARNVEDGARETDEDGETLGRSHSDLQRFARWPNP